jgi:hypothetical protein
MLLGYFGLEVYEVYLENLSIVNKNLYFLLQSIQGRMDVG